MNKTKTIKFKLLFLMIASVISIAAISSVYSIKHYIASNYDFLKKKGLMLAENIAYDSEFSVSIGDETNLDKIIKGVEVEKDVVYVVVQDSEGGVLASAGKNIIKEILGGAVNEQAMATIASGIHPVKTTRGELYDVVVPITQNVEGNFLAGNDIDANGESDKIGIVRVGLTPSYVQKDVRNYVYKMILLTLGVLAVTILLIIYFVLKVIAPIKLLTDTTTTASDTGDLTKKIQIDSKDEIGQLGRAFNKLIENLNAIIRQIRDGAQQVALTSNGLFSVAEQQAAGIKEEATQISETATAIKELAATAEQVSNHSKIIASSAKSSAELITDGNQKVDNVVSGMDKINKSVLETGTRIEALGESSQSITEIVGLIEDIAEQTNLLSLNASVEAARAGEAGKGFSVVADAIGKLSERTAKSTKDISNIIKGIQKETSLCVMSMEKTTKETEVGYSLAKEAGKKLQDIEAAFQQVASSAKEISLSSQQQMSGSTQISKTMNEMDVIMKQAAGGAKDSASSAKELTQLADNLKKEVAQFKIADNLTEVVVAKT